MTLLQLQYFQVLARVLHYTRAAEELHISQPSLSYSINELEKELNVKLFDKENRRITLTVYGQQFLPYVDKSLALITEGAGVLQQMAGTSLQIVKLGYFHSISTSLIPSMMEGIYASADNSKIRFQFTENTSFDIFNQLKTGALDLAFCMHRDTWAESITIMKQPLYLAVAHDHPLAQKSSVRFEEFAREPQIMLDKPSSMRTMTDRIYTQRGVIPNVVFEVRECNAALQYVSLKFGVSILPPVPAMREANVVAIPIEDPDKEFIRTVYLSWSKTRPLSPAAQKVRNYIVERYAASDPS